jgi:hypothetical protein
MKHQINMPNPCHEKRESMTPVEQGRHCAVCQTKVMDFSSASHREVVAYLQTHDNVCANLPSALLSTPALPSSSTSLQKIAMTAISALALGVSNHVMADNIDHTQNQYGQSSRMATPLKNPKYIKGIVHRPNSEEGLVGVRVSLVGTPYCTLTNADGEFALAVEPSMYKNGISLQVMNTRSGDENKTVLVSRVKKPVNIAFEMPSTLHMRGRIRLDDQSCADHGSLPEKDETM